MRSDTEEVEIGKQSSVLMEAACGKAIIAGSFQNSNVPCASN
jgi:hypothetical protein